MEVRAQNILKLYHRRRGGANAFAAVEPCDFLLPAGKLTVIGGRSGSGKSTLLNMLAGILTPSQGQVMYDGADLYAMQDDALSRFRAMNIGYIPQGRSAVSSLTVMENVMLPLILSGEAGEQKALEEMRRFGILDLKDAMPEKLSGGELRRMAIARALMRSPKVLFADEPTGDLDDENTELVFRELRRIADTGCAVLMVTHEESASAYADRLFRMNAGRVEEAGEAGTGAAGADDSSAAG